jgi:hypothetical protein
MEALNIESDVTDQFLFGGLDFHFARIFHPSFSVQKLFKISCFATDMKCFEFGGGGQI